jgi:hypothetical protein
MTFDQPSEEPGPDPESADGAAEEPEAEREQADG